MKRIKLTGNEFIAKILQGERDFDWIELQEGFNLSGHERFEELQAYLKKNIVSIDTSLRLESSKLGGLNALGIHLPYLTAKNVYLYDANLSGANLQGSYLIQFGFKSPQLAVGGINL